MKGKTYCNLIESSPCSGLFTMSYSDGRGTDLDERSLAEESNIGRGAADGAYADWNNDGLQSSSRYSRNLNPQYDSTLNVLRDHNEWAALRISFARGYSGSNTGNTLSAPARQPRHNPMNNNPRVLQEEKPLPSQVKLMVQHLKEQASEHEWKKHKVHGTHQ
jgi:hypothetical protein